MNRDMESGILVFGMGSLGVIFAFLVGVLYEEGIIVDELITGTISLTDVQIFIIILFIVFSLIMGALNR